MIRTLAILLALTLTGCADVRFYAAWYADTAIHRGNQKVLTMRVNEHCGQVVGMVRANEAIEYIAWCDTDCNCKLVKGRVPVDPNADICR